MSDRVQSLCDRAKEGDATAASELVALFYERIYAYLRGLGGNDEDAADLTQRTFFKAWLALASYQGRSSFSTWLHGIAYHVHVDWQRKKSPSGVQSDEWWAEYADGGANPFENAVERDLAGRAYSLVDRLEESVRDVIHLHYYQGLSISETAEALNIAASTVKYRMRAALDFLRAEMDTPCKTNRNSL